MSDFVTFLRQQSLSNIFKMYLDGFLNDRSFLVKALEVIQQKVVFENYDLIDIELHIYNQIVSKSAPNGALSVGRKRTANVTGIDQPSTSGVNNGERAFSRNEDSEDIDAVNDAANIQIGGGDTEHLRFLRVLQEREVTFKKFALIGRRIKFSLLDHPSCDNPMMWYRDAVNEVLDYASRGFQPDDFVGIVFENEDFVEKPIYVSFRRLSQHNADVIMDLLAAVLQSNRNFFTNDRLTLQIDCVRPPTGCGYSAVDGTGVSFDEFSLTKNSVFVIENKDNLCLASALVVAKHYCDNNFSKSSLKIFKSNRGLNQLENTSVALCKSAGVNLSNGGGYAEIDRFQDYFGDAYTIAVYSNRQGSDMLFEGPRAPGRYCLNLICENNHFNVILTLTGLFATRYFCEFCHKKYTRKACHGKCPYTCPCCFNQPPCDIRNPEIKCVSCFRKFRGPTCIEMHQKTNVCNKIKHCDICRSTYHVNNKSEQHVCGVKYCNMCGDNKPVNHLCYMKPYRTLRRKKGDGMTVFVFYDFETTQDTPLKEGVYLHTPNLCVVQQVCTKCISDNDDIKKPCGLCGIRDHVFEDEPVKQLMNYIATLSKCFKVTAIAHNMKAFDGCFVLQHVFSNISRWNPSIIKNGTKIMSIVCGSSVRFIDSINFIQLPLSQFPKAFNLSETKGYFPHYFNTQVNQTYVGPFPERKYYGYDTMKDTERSIFLEWYNEQASKIFNLQVELLKYCRQDVEILRKGCLKFRESFIAISKFDPLVECITIASACNLVFRKHFLKENTIAIIPRGGYRLSHRQSSIAVKWLLWEGYTNNVNIQHAGTAREVMLKEGLRVDGYCPETKTVYEFHGCWWHGCEKCFPNQTAEMSRKNEFLYQRRESTSSRDELIINAGYTLKTMRECAFSKLIKRDNDLRAFIERQAVLKHEPLDPRDSFFGGRTNACKLYHQCEDGEKIKYFDVCSLYPFINKYAKYPVGHPKLYVGDAECRKINLQTIEGLVKCVVLPPENLYHPVLPFRCGNKLTFPLCKACVETVNQEACQHASEERQFVGTFVADELRKALEKGYRVTELFEIWEYNVTTYDSVAKQGGLFTEYVNAFLKLKQEASGWPNECVTDEEKNNYIEQYLEREGVVLDKNKIYKNPGARFLAKIMLNSFWGKFGERPNLQQTTIVNHSADLFRLITTPSIVVQSIVPVNEDVLLASWTYVEEEIKQVKTSNVVLAAYTTANARLVLYQYLDLLGRQVLYYDTDSVIFTHKEGEHLPSIGNFLGDLTDEMAVYGEGSYISEFVSAGPKNYAYKYWNSIKQCYETSCKVKGLTLHYKNAQIINFNKIKAMVLGEDPEQATVLRDNSIVRNNLCQVMTKETVKTYKVCYTKRRRLEGSYDTLPYGFRN